MSVYATCGCGAEIATETAAQRHARECSLMGYPAGWDRREWVPGHWAEAS